MFNKFRKQLAQFIAPALNSMSLPNQFLRFGNREVITPNWSEILTNDKDLYTGYVYGAIRNRANYVARIAVDHVATKSDISNETELVHPYLQMIWNSKTFSEYAFWYVISTYLDLEGVFYLMIVRAYDENRKQGTGSFGNALEFELLNPYNVRRIVNEKTLEVGGYVEMRNGLEREIPPEMIIEIRELNPFKPEDPYSMTDAAKDNQFTLKTAGDYTRHSIRGNINAPGIISTDVMLEDEKFKNFKARVQGHVKGGPIFANGKGTIDWKDMQVDLNKAALKDTNEITRDAVLSTYGMSKTMMGIEQSGTTRDTARVQKDLLIEGQVLPRVQLIIDALNLDYRNKYPGEYAKSEMYMWVENPQQVDQAAEKTKTEVKTANFELYQSLLAAGYSPKKAAAFVEGSIDVDKLGKPKEVKPASTPTNTDTEEEDNDEVVTESAIQHTHALVGHTHSEVKKKVNELPTEDQQEIENQKGNLKTAVINVQRQLVAEVISHVEKNQLEEESDILTKTEKKRLEKELALVLAAFYTINFQSKGRQTMNDRVEAFGMTGLFALNRQMKAYIKQVASKVSVSHIDTLTQEILQVAQEAALEGLSQAEIVSRIRQSFSDDVSTKRAELVARTETNRAFTMAQYEADKQFIKQNELEGKAYKRWKTRSAAPCAFCKSLEDEGLIPFDINFRDLGEVVTVGSGEDKKTLKINFESLQAGNAHPNCSCIYELVIK